MGDCGSTPRSPCRGSLGVGPPEAVEVGHLSINAQLSLVEDCSWGHNSLVHLTCSTPVGQASVAREPSYWHSQ